LLVLLTLGFREFLFSPVCDNIQFRVPEVVTNAISSCLVCLSKALAAFPHRVFNPR
jgi:hypothetical protein